MNTGVGKNIEIFDGSHYASWKMRIRAHLKELQLIDVIDEEIPDPRPSDWTRKNNTAVSEIMDYLANSHLHYIDDKDALAKDIFKNLDAVYQIKSFFMQRMFMQKLMNFKLEDNTNLNDHFEKLEKLGMDLISAGGTFEENDKIFYLLSSMPKSYESVVDLMYTLADESNFNLQYVKSLLLKKETSLKDDSSLNQARQWRGHRGRGSFRRYRGYFNGRNNHYQPKFNTYKHNESSRRNRFFDGKRKEDCEFCGRIGHYINACRYKARYESRRQIEDNKGSTITECDLESSNDNKNFSTSYFAYGVYS